MTAAGWRDTTKTDFRPTLAVDFDGVVNPYSRGWQGGRLYEREVTPGFWPWLARVTERFDVVIHSFRFGDEEAKRAARDWLAACYEAAGRLQCPSAVWDSLDFRATKPPAWLTIDDRCVRFDGDWLADELQPEALLTFKPWTQRS